MQNLRCIRPKGRAGGFKNSDTNIWNWKKPKWKRCHCGMWHSNRYIPRHFWTQNWEIKSTKRQKVGVILVRDKKELWMTQSYHGYYGFPKGEKEQEETVENCAKREFKEETGCSIDNYTLKKCMVIKTGLGENIQYIFYIIHVPREFELYTFPEDDVEITSFGWVRIEDIDKLRLSKAIRRVFDMYKKNIWLINRI